jgi:hypothetical protein
MEIQPLHIGLDFDNTIVSYDSTIGLLAEEMFTLPPELPRTKIGLRDHLRDTGRENEWTAFQGILYGPGMAYAQPFDGAIETMQALKAQGHKLTIVSQRSRRPYSGPSHDLHEAARFWIAKHLHVAGLFVAQELNPDCSAAVNFLESRDAKIAKIAELGCHIFVDDLPEVLEAPGFPEEAVGVLFAPGKEGSSEAGHNCISTWQELPELLSQLP